MEKFCSDPLWDQNLTWGNHRDYPMFTECFQDVVLGMVPSLWLLASFPIYLLVLFKKKDLMIPRSWFYQAKMGLAFVQISIRFNDLFNLITDVDETGEDLTTIHDITASIEVASFLATLVLIEMERQKNCVTSVVLTIYWFLTSVCGVLVFYCKFMEPNQDDSSFDLVTFQSLVACSILQFVLHCFSDPAFYQPGERPPALERASLVSRLFYTWAEKYLVSGYTKNLEDKDFDELAQGDTCITAGKVLRENWDADKRRNENGKMKSTKGSLLRVLCRTYAADLIGSNILRVLDLCTDVARHLCLGYLIGFADDKSQPTWKAYVYLGAVMLCNIGPAINFNYINYQCMHLSKRVRTALDYMIFQKSLRITNRSRAEKTMGDMTNLLNEDVEYVKHWMAYVWVVWSVPLEFIFYTALLYNVVGVGVVAALCVLALTVPFNTWVAKYGHVLQKNRTDLKDERIRLLTELLNGILVLKYYAWELAVGDKVLDIRKKEMKTLMKQRVMGIVMRLLFGTSPYFMAFAALATFVYFDEDHRLTAPTAFVTLSVINGFTQTFSVLPHIFTHFTKAFTSVKRLDEFLNLEEIDPDDVTHNTSDNAVSINSGQFTWNPQMGPCLKDIQLDVPRGSLIAIVGRIGCGKSSLLSAILGEMEKNEGTVNVDGNTGYVPQIAWIQNATLKDNILFGDRTRTQTYKDIIEACALTKDLEILPAGDQTEIGEKGVNLSGGQKQRVSLARAVYSNADIYLLDDPLSAVDAHVGKHIFDHVIGSTGLLRNKTRILVTHGTTWLPYVDTVISMENGQIAERGHYDELMQHDGPFAKFIKEYSLNKDDVSEVDDNPESLVSMVESGYISTTSSEDEEKVCHEKFFNKYSSISTEDLPGLSKRKMKPRIPFNRSISRAFAYEDSKPDDKKTNGEVHDKNLKNKTGQQIEEDEIEYGTMKLRHIKTYLMAIGPWYCSIGFVAIVLVRAVELFGDYNIRNWTSDADLQNLTEYSGDSEHRQERNNYYLKVHAIVGCIKLVLVSIYNCIFSVRLVHAAEVLHSKLLHNVLRGPMAFFDSTPVGRIVHRFSGDLEPLDGALYEQGHEGIRNMFDFLKVMFVVTFTFPQFLGMLPPLVVIYYYIQKYFVPTRRQISRLRSKRRTPIISHFSETLNGTTVIRAFSKERQFVHESAKNVDYYHELEFMDIGIERWLDVRVNFLNAIFITGAVLTAIYNRHSLTGPMLGLVLGTAEILNRCMHGFVRIFGEIQKNAVCLEKMDEYSTKKTEAAIHTSVKPSPSWPATGEVKLTNFSLRYKDDLPLILNGINLSVKPGEMIGICGRTGAGKTSLTRGLFRLVEASQGSINIDGHDISDVGLFDLRSSLTILPQDPVLFSGSLKDNLDPLNHHSEERIWDALQHSHLKQFVDSLPGKLDYQCGEGGQNLSVGQRQLICLARCLLRKSKVLVLDEATSAVDMETDELIQKTLKTEFKGCTVLTIAHRLNTIIDYDRLLVLERGQVKEFDTPETLLSNPDGTFYAMAKDAGLV